MSPVLQALVALQKLDTAADVARKRLADLPAAERDIQNRVEAAAAAVDGAKARLAENQTARRDLEKQVAQVDTRLARFDDHKAAVKTNQEFTALLHEIATAKGEKDTIEDKILVLMESADAITADVKASERALADGKREGEAARASLEKERGALNGELTRLADDRKRETAAIERPVLAKYDQILKQRRMVAVAQINGEMCTACYVRLRPTVAQHVRRNDEIVQCDSCQRILYYEPKDGQ